MANETIVNDSRAIIPRIHLEPSHQLNRIKDAFPMTPRKYGPRMHRINAFSFDIITILPCHPYLDEQNQIGAELLLF